MTNEFNFILLTGRTWQQGATMEGPGKMSSSYQEAVATCEIDPDDMNGAGIEENSNVRITSEFNSIVIKARTSSSGPHRGQIFMPLGFWANILIGSETHGTGMPTYKGIPVKVEKSDDPVLDIKQLLAEHF
ncbi:MAG: molybdopterin dinucleotide binding domain-containing protein [Candidatus Hodarchaeales archaeon]|jgi:formylmethanofuran dehydrogenase subunit D